MKKEKKAIKKSKRISIFQIIGIIIGLVLMFLGFWPIERIEKKVQKLSSDLDNLGGMNCAELEKLGHYCLVINYPKLINLNDSGQITVSLSDIEDSFDSGQVHEVKSSCLTSLEVFLEIRGFLVEPGQRILEPFTGQKNQTFIFNLLPLIKKGIVRGNIWIVAIFHNETEGQLERLPLVVVPVEIAIRSLLGLSPRIVRGFGLILFIFQILLISCVKKPDDII